MNLNNNKHNVDFDVFEKKLKRFLKTSEERQKEAARHAHSDGYRKQAKPWKSWKEGT